MHTAQGASEDALEESAGSSANRKLGSNLPGRLVPVPQPARQRDRCVGLPSQGTLSARMGCFCATHVDSLRVAAATVWGEGGGRGRRPK